MANTTPKLPMLALNDNDGNSVNDTALCILCLSHPTEVEQSKNIWRQAEGVTFDDYDVFTPVDNPDATCNGCGALAHEEYIA